DSQLQALYASSFAWVSFLLTAHFDRFSDFERRLAAGEAPARAFDAAFTGLDRGALWSELVAYLREGQLGVLRAKAVAYEGPLEVRRLPDAVVHVIRAQMIHQRPAAQRAEL